MIPGVWRRKGRSGWKQRFCSCGAECSRELSSARWMWQGGTVRLEATADQGEDVGEGPPIYERTLHLRRISGERGISC